MSNVTPPRTPEYWIEVNSRAIDSVSHMHSAHPQVFELSRDVLVMVGDELAAEGIAELTDGQFIRLSKAAAELSGALYDAVRHHAKKKAQTPVDA